MTATKTTRWIRCPVCRRKRPIIVVSQSEIVRAESRPCRDCAQRSYRQGPP